jgi:hypothetical protein
MLLWGGAGGGKSKCAAEKIKAFCYTYPGTTALVLRKVSTAMTNSIVAFFEKEIFPEAIETRKVIHYSTASRFVFDNGSVIYYSGMINEQQRENIRSAGQHGGIDIVWMEEGIQFDEEDYNELLPRLRGRAAPWTQFIISTNPESPAHWIHRRIVAGKEGTSFFSVARDNPHNPDDYEEEKLGKLTGDERKRLLDGKWVQSGGLVLDQWVDKYDSVGDHGGNITDKADYIPGGGPVHWFVDDGYAGEMNDDGTFKSRSHPRAFIMAQVRQDGQIAIFGESYEVQMLAPEHITEVVYMCKREGWPRPSRVVYDRPAASLGRYLEEELKKLWSISGNAITFNVVPVEEGNKELNTRLSADKNGWRQIIVHPRLKHFRLEALTYRKNPKTGRPVKDFDHGIDAARIGIWDYVHGGPTEQDFASPSDVTIIEKTEQFNIVDDVESYQLDGADIAVII